ncbi:PREDICTED: cytokine-dependent hematopoietic cell linker [Chrysochloris asiatica]|uniref:Cytokine-dependent hematopoietic cell linker n=1 Tax=Chrysochloris asiatica TaxID=185453 RepID=A0A9B0U2E6_CHRAS|nr:PREDICTED: cytokine-dependent hematopoietic cell linker [Chrysochloris asiatica]
MGPALEVHAMQKLADESEAIHQTLEENSGDKASDAGQYQTINEPHPNYDRNIVVALDEAKGHSGDYYEDPELAMAEGWQSISILPARPIKESEYAVRNENPYVNTPVAHSQYTILRPPMTLLKKYQPLPPEPENSRLPFFQRHTFPETQRGPRQISLKDLSDVSSNFALGTIEANIDQMYRQDMGTLLALWGVQHHDWYIGEYSRQAVEEALMKENKDGTFLVRDCSSKSTAEPYVLVVFYGNKVYNVKIRFLEKNQQFALGTGLRGTEKFDSVEDIIEHYKYFPVTLIDGKDKTGVRREQCFLTQPLPFSLR